MRFEILAALIAVGVALSLSGTSAFTFGPSRPLRPFQSTTLQHTQRSMLTQDGEVEVLDTVRKVARAGAILSTAAFINFGFGMGALAEDNGSKAAKKFEGCVSKCVFSETKPPPVGADPSRLEARKPRSEIIADCRSKCAKTKEQTLLGKPKQKASTEEAAQPVS
jgi:hypothetical protein